MTMSNRAGLPNPIDYMAWSESPDAVLHAYATDAEVGLDDREILKRRMIFGLNRLRESRPHAALVVKRSDA